MAVLLGGSGVAAVALLVPVSGAGPVLNLPRVIRVPEDKPTIAAALAVARADDTVQVAAGIYSEGHLSVRQGVHLVGKDGWESTVIEGGGLDWVVDLDHNSRLEGFTVRGSGPDFFNTGIWVDQGTVTIRGNRITGNATGVWAWCWNPATCDIRVTMENNLIDHNDRFGVNSNEHPVFVLRNNTVVYNHESGVILNNSGSRAENNIIASNGIQGLANNAAAGVSYNDVWDNGEDYVGEGPGVGDFSLDPMFRDAAGEDYRLHAGSPAVGHGTPAGTDVGAFPFEPIPMSSPPAALSLTQTGISEATVSWDETSAVGYMVYVGMKSGWYTERFDAGDVSSYRLSGLSSQRTYYVGISGYNASHDESDVSSAASLLMKPFMVTVQGPSVGAAGISATFTATVEPLTTTQPITYSWQTSEQVVTHVGDLTDTAVLSWTLGGAKSITLTATNPDASYTAQHNIMVHAPPTAVSLDGPSSATVGDHNLFSATISPITTTTPINYLWQTREGSFARDGDLDDSARIMLLYPGPQTITVTAGNPAGSVTATHHITLNLAAETRVIISGPSSGLVAYPVVFTATTVLGTMDLPDTYVWEATGQEAVTQSNSVRDNVAFSWVARGTETITVTVKRGTSVYGQDTHVILIKEALYLPLVLRSK